jgi:hypothetical protein
MHNARRDRLGTSPPLRYSRHAGANEPGRASRPVRCDGRKESDAGVDNGSSSPIRKDETAATIWRNESRHTFITREAYSTDQLVRASRHDERIAPPNLPN